MTNYTVTFERIGRERNLPPLVVEADGPDHLAEVVYHHARPHLVSRDVEVVVDLGAGTGQIFCGFNNGGTFTVAAGDAP